MIGVNSPKNRSTGTMIPAICPHQEDYGVNWRICFRSYRDLKNLQVPQWVQSVGKETEKTHA
jgi:hypothetical protein